MRTQGTCLHIEVRPKLNPALAVGLSLVSCHDSPRFPVNCHRNVVAVRKTASHRPSTMIKLCRDLGVPHSGRRAQLANHLRIRRSTLPQPITVPDTAITPTTTAQVSAISLQPAFLPSPTHHCTVHIQR